MARHSMEEPSHKKKLSNKAKIIATGLLIWISLLAIGTFVPFLPSRAIMIGALAVSLLLTGIVYVKIKPVNVNHSIKLFAALVAFFFTYETIAKPIPFILHSFLGEPGHENTMVTGKDSSVSNTSTRYYINTEIPYWFVIGRGLTVSENQYNRIKIGDNVQLEGKKSLFGFSVSRITKH